MLHPPPTFNYKLSAAATPAFSPFLEVRTQLSTDHFFAFERDIGLYAKPSTLKNGLTMNSRTCATQAERAYSRYAFFWQGCATKVAPSFSPRSREIAVLRLYGPFTGRACFPSEWHISE